MRKILITMTVMAISLNGCANMTKEQQAMWGAGAGALLGAGIGGAIGGGKGAAIGGASGALLGGLAAYALANDPYTQSVNRQATTWQQQTGAQTQAVKTKVVENGQPREQIDQQKMILSDDQMLTGKHLSKTVKNQLITAKNESLKAGGTVHVICPASATPKIIKEINATGVTSSQDNSLNTGYVVVLSRKINDYRT